jgi:hypothetical protein
MATALANPAQQDDPQATGNAPVVQDPPEAQPLTFGENNRELPDQLKDVLEQLVKEFQNEDMYDKRVEDLIDRKLRFYDDGVQHFYADLGTGAYQIGAQGAFIDLGENSFTCGDYMGAYNITRARRRTIDSVLTQNPPGIVFEPDRPDRSEDQEAAETAEGYRHLFDQKNSDAELQQQVTRFIELSGRVVSWTFTTANQQKWGVNDKGEPRKSETAMIFGTLESSVPILCKRQEDALYCFLYRDLHVLKLKSENPWLKDEDGSWKFDGSQSGPGESDWKRYARLGTKQTNKSAYIKAFAHITTEMHCFIRPEAFAHTCCEEVYTGATGWDGENYTHEPLKDVETIADMLKMLFPEGVHIKYCGKAYSESYAESMDDSIDIVMAEERDSLTGGALMEPMAIIQDEFNDEMNAAREYCEKGWPMTHMRGDGEDYDTIVQQQSRPGQFNLIKSPVGPPDQPLANNFYREPDMSIPVAYTERLESLRGPISQDITGASPALEGVAGAKEETASQRAMDKAQSMGILGPAWSRVQRVFAGIYKKAALKAAKNPDHAQEIAVATGDKTTVTIRLEKLTRGKFHCNPDTDSTFPDSTAAKRANLDQMLPLILPTPIGQIFLQSPKNWEEILRIKGMSNFELVPAQAYDKQIREIEILLREAPEENTQAVQQYNVQHAQISIQAMQQGMPPAPYTPPPPLKPSIMPDILDYHNFEFECCKEWLTSQDCWREELYGGDNQQGNPDGVKNVRLHAMFHQQMMQALAPPPMPAPPPGKPAPKNANAPQAAPQVQASSQPPGAPGQPTM